MLSVWFGKAGYYSHGIAGIYSHGHRSEILGYSIKRNEFKNLAMTNTISAQLSKSEGCPFCWSCFTALADCKAAKFMF